MRPRKAIVTLASAAVVSGLVDIAAAQDAQDASALEVVVEAERREIGASEITRDQTREIPGSLGDPLRAIEVLPGVVPVASGVPLFFVRGAPPGHVGYFIDGIRIPLLYHVGAGPSVVHPAFIQRVELFRGAYPARFGRFAGGIVAATTSRPSGEIGGEASVRLFDAGAMVTAPFASGRGSAMLGGRYSYTGLLVSLLSDARLDYWDYQAMVSYDLGSRDTLGVLGFGAHDLLEQDDELVVGTEFHRIDLRYERRLDEAGASRFRAATTLGLDRTRIPEGAVADKSLGIRPEIVHRLHTRATLRAGLDIAVDRFSLDIDNRFVDVRDARELFPTRTELTLGAFADVALTPESWLRLTPGLRVDRFETQGASAVGVDPRVSAEFSVTDDFRILHAVGIAHQSADFVPNVPGARVSSVRGELQTAIQASSGIEIDLPERTLASATVFDNVILNLSDPLGVAAKARPDADFADQRALGSAVGLELMLHRPLTRRLGGMLSYTLSRATRNHGRLESLSAFDRTHVLQLALAHELGKYWRAGSRLVLFSGVPTSRRTTEGPRFSGDDRAPPFYRIDLRLEKRWVLPERRYWSLVFEVINATLSREVLRRECSPDGCRESSVGPLTLPSIGVEAAF